MGCEKLGERVSIISLRSDHCSVVVPPPPKGVSDRCRGEWLVYGCYPPLSSADSFKSPNGGKEKNHSKVPEVLIQIFFSNLCRRFLSIAESKGGSAASLSPASNREVFQIVLYVDRRFFYNAP